LKFEIIENMSKTNEMLIDIRKTFNLESKYVVKCYNSWIEDNNVFIQTELCSQTLQHFIWDKHCFFMEENSIVMNCIDLHLSCQLLREILDCVLCLHESVDNIDWKHISRYIFITSNNEKDIPIAVNVCYIKTLTHTNHTLFYRFSFSHLINKLFKSIFKK